MADRIDVSRLSVAECLALGGDTGEAPMLGVLQSKLEKIVKEVEKEGDRVGRARVQDGAGKCIFGLTNA